MDGNVISSEFSEWTDYSIKKRVNKGTGFKMAYVSMFPVKHITVHHNGLEKSLDVPEGYDVFQSIVGNTIITNGVGNNSVLGRTVGLVKGDSVTEEYFLDGITNNVIGYKYDH